MFLRLIAAVQLQNASIEPISRFHSLKGFHKHIVVANGAQESHNIRSIKNCLIIHVRTVRVNVRANLTARMEQM